MKNRLRLFILLFSFSLVTEARSSNSTKSVAVEIELEEIPNVKNYEIEVKKTSDSKESQLNFLQKESLFKIKLEVGNYQFRTRFVSVDSEVGPWSDWSELLARPDVVASIDIPVMNVALRKNQPLAELALKWPKANGAEKYVVWIEDQLHKTTAKETSAHTGLKLKLKLGEYKIGVQSISKDGIKSKVKYLDDSVFVAKTRLPQIKLARKDFNSFNWLKQSESNVKIEVFRKPFFGDKYTRIQSLKENGESWRIPSSLQPGEYRIEFQYISESFENGPIETISFLKKPNEKDFSQISK